MGFFSHLFAFGSGILASFVLLFFGIHYFLNKRVAKTEITDAPPISQNLLDNNGQSNQLATTSTGNAGERSDGRKIDSTFSTIPESYAEENVRVGWMKLQHSFKVWGTRWFVLRPGLLLYYGSNKAKKVWGIVRLEGCKVMGITSKKGGFAFKIYHPENKFIYCTKGLQGETIRSAYMPGGGSIMKLRILSGQDRDEWMKAVEIAALLPARLGASAVVSTTDVSSIPANDDGEDRIETEGGSVGIGGLGGITPSAGSGGMSLGGTTTVSGLSSPALIVANSTGPRQASMPALTSVSSPLLPPAHLGKARAVHFSTTSITGTGVTSSSPSLVTSLGPTSSSALISSATNSTSTTSVSTSSSPPFVSSSSSSPNSISTSGFTGSLPNTGVTVLNVPGLNPIAYSMEVTPTVRDYYDGEVEVRDATGRLWEKRWIVVRKGLLVIFNSEASADCTALIDLEACEVRYWTERIGERERRMKGRKRSETYDITASTTSDTLSPTGLKKKMYDSNEQPTTVLSDGEDEFGWNSNNHPTNDYEKVPEEGGGSGGISSHLPTNRQTSSSSALSLSSLSPQTSPKKEQQTNGNLAQDGFPTSELSPRKKEKHRRSMSCDMDLPDSPAKGAAIGGAGDFESTVSSIRLSPSTQAANAKKRVDALDLHNTKHFRHSSNVELSKPGSGYSTPTATSSTTIPNLPASLIIAGVLYTAEADEEGKHTKGSKAHEKKQHKKTKRKDKERTEADTTPGAVTSSSSESLATPHLQAQLQRPYSSLPSALSSPNDTSLVTLSTSSLTSTPTSSTPISISTSPSTSLQPSNSNSNSNTTPPPVSAAVTTISGFTAPTVGTPLVSLISSPRTARGEDHDRWFSDEDDVYLPDDAEGKGKHKKSKEKKASVGVSTSSTKDYSNETKEQERIRRESEKKEKELQKSIEKERKKKEKEEKKEEKHKKKQEKKEAKTLIKEKEIEDPKEVERLRKEQDRKEKEVQRASEKERKRKEKEEKREQERQKKLIKRRRSAGASLNNSVSGDSSSGLPLSFSSSELLLGENGLGTSEEISTATMERHLKSELQDYLSGGEATDSDNESDKETGGKDEESTQQQETNHNNASNTINNPNPNASRFAFELFSTSHRSIFVQIPSFSGKKDPKQKPFLDTTADSLVIRTATGEDLEWWMDVVRECCACRFIHELPTQLPHYINTLVSQQEFESCSWFNVLMTRYFKEMQHSPAFANKVKQVISKLFNKMNPKRPKFLAPIVVDKVTIGHSFPDIKKVRLVSIPTSQDDELVGELDVSYNGGASVTISTAIYINWPTPKFATVPLVAFVKLEHLEGKLQVYGARELFSRISASFDCIPKLEFSVNLTIGEKKYELSSLFPQIKAFIINALKKIIWKNTVAPNKFSFSLPLPDQQLRLKTEKLTSRRSRARREHERALLGLTGTVLNSPYLPQSKKEL